MTFNDYYNDLYLIHDLCVIRCKRRNVNVCFQRFEDQDRHAIHTHILVWIQSLGRINYNQFKASIPKDHSLLAYLVNANFL